MLDLIRMLVGWAAWPSPTVRMCISGIAGWSHQTTLHLNWGVNKNFSRASSLLPHPAFLFQVSVCMFQIDIPQWRAGLHHDTPWHLCLVHPPWARGWRGSEGWPGCSVRRPWRCRDRRCCCWSCCICKSCCWKASCWGATCCCCKRETREKNMRWQTPAAAGAREKGRESETRARGMWDVDAWNHCIIQHW